MIFNSFTLFIVFISCTLDTLVGSQKIETSIGSDLKLDTNISSTGGPSPLKTISNLNETEKNTNDTSHEKLQNPKIIPVNTDYVLDSCFNKTLPINCNNSNSTLSPPIMSRATVTISGDSQNSTIKYEFKSIDDEDLIVFGLNLNDKKALLKIKSLVNDTMVNKNLTTLELAGNSNEFAINNNKTSSIGTVNFVMVLTNTTVSFTINNSVYAILNINLAESPVHISQIFVKGLDNPNIHIQPFLQNDDSESCNMEVSLKGDSEEGLYLLSHAVTCLTRNLYLPETIPSGSQFLLGIPGNISMKSVRIASNTEIILTSRSGVVIFTLIINDKGIFLKSTEGTDVIQSKGGYFPFQSYGFQSYVIKLTFTSLFVSIKINGFHAFDHILIPENEYPSNIHFKGLHLNPTITFLPNRACSKFSYSGDTSCSLDGIVPKITIPGGLDDNVHGKTVIAVKMISDSQNSEKRTSINFNNNDETTEFLVGVKGRNSILVTNTTDLTKNEFDNNPSNDTFSISNENNGGAHRCFFNNIESVDSTKATNVLNDFSVEVIGEKISKISSEFVPTKKSCVLEQHRGSYISTICESDRLCFATGSTGSSTGGTLFFIGGFLNGSIKVLIYTKSEDLSYKIEYQSNGNITIKRTTAIKEDEPIYSGHYLDQSNKSNRGLISIKDLGQYFLISIDKAEITRLSKNGYGTQGNISCVQLISNESDNKAIYFEIQ